ncbi:MAG: hypothetical protein K2H20_01315 [Bacilli bacterium]|nr:hypothetical protein [Bacilli bacterium]
MDKAKEKLTFSKIEILFMIVMVALVIVAGITVFSVTTQKQNIKNFKDDTLYLTSLAKNSYASFKMTNNTEYIVTGSDGQTKGMCITINGLKENDFLTKEYKDWDGYIVIEEGLNNKYNYSVWVTNKKYVIDGYDSEKLQELTTKNGITSYNKESFVSKVSTSFTGTTTDKGGSGSSTSNLKRYEAKCIDEKIA